MRGGRRPLDALDLAGLLIDGVHVGGHCIVVALGIDKTGAKHPLGLWEGATENATVCQGLLTNLASRGLRTDRSLLVIVDGAKALDTAVTQTFGRGAVVQRCQVHKGRNILEHLPEAQRPWVTAILRRAYTHTNVKTAKRLLQDLARRLDTAYPSAAASVREGLDETLTVLGLGLSERLQRSLATTNAIESLLSRTRHLKRNVKRWRGGTMVLRWVAAGVLEAAKGFRRVKGRKDMPTLVAALRARDRAPGTRGVVRDGRIVVNRAAAEFQQRTGHPQIASRSELRSHVHWREGRSVVRRDDDEAVVIHAELSKSVQEPHHNPDGATSLPSEPLPCNRTRADEDAILIQCNRLVRNPNMKKLVYRPFARHRHPSSELFEEHLAVDRKVAPNGGVAELPLAVPGLQSPRLIVVDPRLDRVGSMPEQGEVDKLPGSKPRVVVIRREWPVVSNMRSLRTDARYQGRRGNRRRIHIHGGC